MSVMVRIRHAGNTVGDILIKLINKLIKTHRFLRGVALNLVTESESI